MTELGSPLCGQAQETSDMRDALMLDQEAEDRGIADELTERHIPGVCKWEALG